MRREAQEEIQEERRAARRYATSLESARLAREPQPTDFDGETVIWTADTVKRARALEKTGDMTRREVAKMLGASERTLFRGLKAARDHDEIVNG